MKDRFKVGPSKVAPRQAIEGYRSRHRRRHEIAVTLKPVLECWAERHGYELDVKNDDQHWILKGPVLNGLRMRLSSPKGACQPFVRAFSRLLSKMDLVVEWWPSTAKLVFDRRYHVGIHVHDSHQICGILSGRIYPRRR
jgi:hypothetical protein